jgi:hypothetical protein
MKKFISVILILAALLTFASCKGKGDDETGTTTYAVPVIEESTHSKEFKDKSGRVVFTVDVVIPKIVDDCDPKVAEYINGVALDIFNEACEFAQSNLEYASKDSTPWTKTITFETTLLDNRYACFLINDVFSVNGDIPILSTLCFDIRKGAPCTLLDFAVNNNVKRVLYKFQIFISHPKQTSDVIFYYFNQLLTICRQLSSYMLNYVL